MGRPKALYLDSLTNRIVPEMDRRDNESTDDWIRRKMAEEDNKDVSVEKPPHYQTGGLEVIDIIEAKLSSEQFKGYLMGNVLKYLFRHEYKGKAVQDLKKGQWYLTKLVDLQARMENN